MQTQFWCDPYDQEQLFYKGSLHFAVDFKLFWNELIQIL
jgi:hypothetical protein